MEGSIEAPGVAVRVTRGHTNRAVEVTSEYYIAERWAQRPQWQLRLLPPAWRVRRAVRALPALTGPPLICFRGRHDCPSIAGVDDMGPPRATARRDGRYSGGPVPVLYLADTILGVSVELGSRRLCIQEFRIDPAALRLADLSVPGVANILAGAFDAAEASKVDGRVARKDYAFSQLLASFVHGAGFDGMIVPGVRAAPGQYYRNVVIFRNIAWRTWCTPDGFSRVHLEAGV